MIADMWAVMRKEWNELFLAHGSFRRSTVSLLFFAGLYGVFLPLVEGASWVESPVSLLYWAWLPLFIVASTIADSFAGERERHTLETLLASPLSDRAILFGKVAASVGYGWGLTLALLVLGLLTVNIAQGFGKLLLYPAALGLGIVLLSLLCAGLTAGAGVLLSLRAATVRGVQQTLSIIIIMVAVVPILTLRILPTPLLERLFWTLKHTGMTRIVLVSAAVLAVLDAGLLAAAMARFKRARLILD